MNITFEVFRIAQPKQSRQGLPQDGQTLPQHGFPKIRAGTVKLLTVFISKRVISLHNRY
jgi:hypothetical protein